MGPARRPTESAQRNDARPPRRHDGAISNGMLDNAHVDEPVHPGVRTDYAAHHVAHPSGDRQIHDYGQRRHVRRVHAVPTLRHDGRGSSIRPSSMTTWAARIAHRAGHGRRGDPRASSTTGSTSTTSSSNSGFSCSSDFVVGPTTRGHDAADFASGPPRDRRSLRSPTPRSCSSARSSRCSTRRRLDRMLRRRRHDSLTTQPAPMDVARQPVQGPPRLRRDGRR